jgi:hypothetical protein
MCMTLSSDATKHVFAPSHLGSGFCGHIGSDGHMCYMYLDDPIHVTDLDPPQDDD